MHPDIVAIWSKSKVWWDLRTLDTCQVIMIITLLSIGTDGPEQKGLAEGWGGGGGGKNGHFYSNLGSGYISLRKVVSMTVMLGH